MWRSFATFESKDGDPLVARHYFARAVNAEVRDVLMRLLTMVGGAAVAYDGGRCCIVCIRRVRQARGLGNACTEWHARRRCRVLAKSKGFREKKRRVAGDGRK